MKSCFLGPRSWSMRQTLRKMRRLAEEGFMISAQLSLMISGHASRRYASLRHTFVRAQNGFAPFRQHWWVQWQLEPIINKLRYMWLICKAHALNDAASVSSGSPSGDGVFRKICMVQLGHLGDMIQTVPALHALRTTCPTSEIVLLTGPWNEEFSRRILSIDRVLYYAPRWEAYVRGQYGQCRSMRAEWDFLIRLRHESFDVVIDCTSGSLPTLLIQLMLRPKTGIGPDVFPAGAFTRCPTWYHCIPYDSRAYEAARIMRLLQPLQVVRGACPIDFPLTDDDRRRADIIKRKHGCLESNDAYVVFAPGAGWPGKMWPWENFAALGQRIRKHFGFQILVVGTKRERSLTQRIAREMGAGGVGLAGETRLGELGALIQQARMLVTNDSGPYHLAAALNVPTVLLFGPGFPSKWVVPRSNQRVLHHEVGCRCYPWHPRARCEFDRACMRAITVDEAWQAVCELMTAHKGFSCEYAVS